MGENENKMLKQLNKIEYSYDGEMLYYPCKVTMKDGTVHENVYVSDKLRFSKLWGENRVDLLDKMLNVEEIENIEESPNRIPAHFATDRYRGGESGMGYTRFALKFDDGTIYNFTGGNAIDFIKYPKGKSSENIVEISAYIENAPHGEVDDYCWCLW